MTEERIDLEDEWILYMHILKCAIWNAQIDKSVIEKYKNVPIDNLIKKAQFSAQRFLLQKYLNEMAEIRGETIDNSYNNELFAILNRYKLYAEIRRVLEAAKEKNILLVVFKGCVLADLYPEYVKRYSCDTDLFVYKEQKEQAVSLIKSLGYSINEEHTNPEVTVFESGSTELMIELHTCLWEDYEGKRLEIIKSFNLTERESLIQTTACGIELTTLNYDNHLIYQLFHIIKHFSLEGIGIKYLADITLFVSKNIDKINAEYFWECMDKLGYTKFTYSLFVICVQYLGMDDTILKYREVEYGDEIVDFFQDLLCSGDMYVNKTAGWQIMGMMTPYFTGERSTSNSSIRRKLEVVFPKSSDLPDEYAYAKKIKILLPIAWVHKIINYLIKYHKNMNTWYSAGEKLDVADHRLKLMKDMGLL